MEPHGHPASGHRSPPDALTGVGWYTESSQRGQALYGAHKGYCGSSGRDGCGYAQTYGKPDPLLAGHRRLSEPLTPHA